MFFVTISTTQKYILLFADSLHTNEYQHHTGSSVQLHFPDPVWNRFECAASSDVIGHHCPMGTAVVALSYGAETLLSRSVPHLHLQNTDNTNMG